MAASLQSSRISFALRNALMAACLALACAAASAVDLPSSCGTWQVVSPLPTEALGAAATSEGINAYVAGGYQFSSDLNQFSRYNLASDSWGTLSPMPDAATGASAVYSPINNKVYVFGGTLISGGAVKNNTRIYDLNGNTWSAGASMPEPRCFMASGYYSNGKIYLIGGYNTAGVTSPKSQVWEYDPIANTWNTSRLSMPHAIGSAGFGVINGHFYVAGGSDGGVNAYNGLFDYDIAGNTWTQRANLFSGINGPGSAVVGGQLWLFGGDFRGDLSGQPTKLSQFYDPVSNSWSEGPLGSQSDFGRSLIAGTAIGSTLFAAGGGKSSGPVIPVNTTEIYDPGAWALKAPYPSVIEAPAVGTDGRFAYSAGGLVNGLPTNGFYRYDAAADKWTSLAPLPIALYGARSAYYPGVNSFYVFGGSNGTTILNTNYKYNVNTGAWTAVAPMPAARFLANVASYSSYIYVIGGFDVSSVEMNQTWRYIPALNSWQTGQTNIPAPMAGSATSVVGQFIYLVGSYNGGSGSTLHNRYDALNNTWAGLAAAPIAVYEAVGAAIGNRTFLVAGGNPSFAPGDAEIAPVGLNELTEPTVSYRSTYIYDIIGNSWTTGRNTKVPHSLTAGTAIGGRLLVVGGLNGSVNTNTVESLSVVCPNCTSFYENFDGVTAPVLPTGWFAENIFGPAPFWITSTTTPQTAPNDSFIDDPGTFSDKRLYSPGIFIASASAQLSFSSFYNLEVTDGTYYDGGVLEIALDGGGSFTDITDAGGSFVSNGYNATINGAFGSPIAGRMAWSGNSVVYNTTLVNLGPNFVGQTIRFRFRMASDQNVAGIGWRIDNFAVTTPDCPPKLLSAVSRKVHGAAGTFDINLPLTGTRGIECRTGAVAGNHQVVLFFAAPITLGAASVSSGTGSIASSSVNSGILTVNLTGVTNAQTITLILNNVTDGVNTGTITIPMSVLAGDTTGSGSVNATDVSQVKLQSGQALLGSNLRNDVNVNGSINASDVSSVKSKSGTALP